MDKKIVVLEYQSDFADNFTSYAYGKIAEKKFPLCCCWENTTAKRENFENYMKDFNLEYSYISKTRVDKINKRFQYIDYRELCSHKIKNDKILKSGSFKLEDIELLTDDIKSMLDFNNHDFIFNYDILEKIENTNSIGLYIGSKDKPDMDYIKNCAKRLNKYILRPKLFIFSDTKEKFNIDIDYEQYHLRDWREEFYFLKKCKHRIIHCTPDSYSRGLWASILGNNEFSYVTYNKNYCDKRLFRNWLKI